MPSRGELGMTVLRSAARPAADLLHEARARERAACIPEAVAAYEATIAMAGIAGEQAVLAEALRRLAVVRHRRAESVGARELCLRSHAVARRAGNGVLAGEALNTLGGIDLETDAIADARQNFLLALELGGQSRALRARVEQNLGVLANIQGDFDEAQARYRGSLEAYRAANDEHGCAHHAEVVIGDRAAVLVVRRAVGLEGSPVACLRFIEVSLDVREDAEVLRDRRAKCAALPARL